MTEPPGWEALPGHKKTAQRDARLAAYAELRDGGAYPADAARDVGVGPETGGRYERWYRASRGLPPKRRSASYSER